MQEDIHDFLDDKPASLPVINEVNEQDNQEFNELEEEKLTGEIMDVIRAKIIRTFKEQVCSVYGTFYIYDCWSRSGYEHKHH